MDIAQFVSDYCYMLRDNGERMPPRQKLAKEIKEALEEYDTEVSVEEVAYYLN